MEVGVLPRNFLGGLSRSPAAGSTTQRSSTNLGEKVAQSGGEERPSPQVSLLRGKGFRAPGRPPQKPLSITVQLPTPQVFPFPGTTVKTDGGVLGKAQRHTQPTPNPRPLPDGGS